MDVKSCLSLGIIIVVRCSLGGPKRGLSDAKTRPQAARHVRHAIASTNCPFTHH